MRYRDCIVIVKFKGYVENSTKPVSIKIPPFHTLQLDDFQIQKPP